MPKKKKPISGWKKWGYAVLGISGSVLVIGWPLLAFVSSITTPILSLKIFGLLVFAFAASLPVSLQAFIIAGIAAVSTLAFFGLITAGFAIGWKLASVCLSGSECMGYEFDQDAIAPSDMEEENSPRERPLHDTADRLSISDTEKAQSDVIRDEYNDSTTLSGSQKF